MTPARLRAVRPAESFAAPRARVRLAPVDPAAALAEAADGEVLVVVPALCDDARGGLAAAARSAGGRLHVAPMRLPGLGARYLAGVAAGAAARGWSAAEAAALVLALEERTAAWIAAPTLRPLERAGWLPRAALSRRPRAARFARAAWTASPATAEALRTAVRAGLVPGALAIGATSGGAGAPDALVAALDGAGLRRGHLGSGLARTLGTAWAVEVVVAPRLSAASLAPLRERIAAARRCDWCGQPLLGATCAGCGTAGR
jgi:hypothetical protein